MRIRQTLLIINVALVLLFCQSAVFAQDNFTIVIDAGHGGKDPGTVNGKNYEKTVNLAVALEVGKILEKNKGFKIVYTRKNDTFIELNERSAIAARNKADLFVSIHTNASENKKAYGTETYIMGVHKNSDNLSVAMRENGVISLESNFSTRYEGYEPNSSESHIMFSLMQYGYSQESLRLGNMIQGSFTTLGRRNLGVKQAGFLVLWKNSMPSVLVELGFLSNPAEMKYLTSRSGQQNLAKSIASSIEEYYRSSGNSVTKLDKAKRAGAHFEVQVHATSKPIAINNANFGAYTSQVNEKKATNMYKYTIGELFLYKEALHLQSELKKRFSGAFVVAFDKDGKQISVREARKIIEK